MTGLLGWQCLCWSGLALAGYTYFGYPSLLALLARRCGRTPEPPAIDHQRMPTATVLLSAYNAERTISRRLENLLESEFPPGRLEIIVVSDGSTDQTAAIAAGYADHGVRVVASPVRRGKAASLAAAFSMARGQVVVFTDVSTVFESQTMARLARWFDDPAIHVVCGRVVMSEVHGDPGIYWKLERWLKRRENQLNALAGASGAVYAIRRRSLVAPDQPVINDDQVFPLLSRLRWGGRTVLDESATAIIPPPAPGQEFRRRCRTGAGGPQGLRHLWPLLHPRHGWIALSYASHKVCRWLTPFALLATFISCLALVSQPLYQALLAAFAALGVLAATSSWWRGNAARTGRAARSFALMNAALMCGVLHYFWQPRRAVWQPTTRLSSPASHEPVAARSPHLPRRRRATPLS